jgi:hypothetical protein
MITYLEGYIVIYVWYREGLLTHQHSTRGAVVCAHLSIHVQRKQPIGRIATHVPLCCEDTH